MIKRVTILVLILFGLTAASGWAQNKSVNLAGKILTNDDEVVAYATVWLKGTGYGCATDEQGKYQISAPAGKYTLEVSAIGYDKVEREVKLTGERQDLNITLQAMQISLDDVVVTGSGVTRVNRSAYNAVAVDAKVMQNTTKNLSDALA
ncbi:MAG: carboxypeptidase-like regulatory domain-containing protein, partial [Muribaculaceae bacterium]